MSKANFEKINGLLAQGVANAKDVRGIAEWVERNQPNLAISIPFVSDYASPDQINTVGITSGNMVNGERRGGQVTMQGETVYFASRNQGGVLYKTDLAGEGFEKLGDDPACFLNVVGDWIYYANQGDDNRVYKMRTDGSERTKVSDDNAEYLSVSDGWIHYSNLSDEGRLYKVRPDGSERTKLSDKFVKFPCVSGEWVYYSSKKDDGTLWKVKVDGSEEQRLPEVWAITHCISDGWVYYLTDRKGMVIDRVRPDGSEAAEVYRYDGKVSTFNVANGRLFVSVSEKETRKDTIAIVNMETGEVEKVLDRITEVICTVGEDWLYFADWNDGDTWYKVNLDSWEIEKLR